MIEVVCVMIGWMVDFDMLCFMVWFEWYDIGDKMIFGEIGLFDGDGFFDILLKWLGIVCFIVGKLWCEFVFDMLELDVFDVVVEWFCVSGYDICVVFVVLWLIDVFWDLCNCGVFVKLLVEFVVGLVWLFDVVYGDL